MKHFVIDWDGKHVPSALRRVPPGKYRLEAADDAPPLTEEEERGLEEALDERDAGKGIPLNKVISKIRRKIRKK